MAKLQLAAAWWTWQNQTGGNKDGLFVRDVWRPVPAARTLGTLDRKAGPCRCGVQHVHLAASGHHLPPVYDPDLRDRVCPWRRVDGLGFIWVIIALLLDLSHWGASYTQRDQIPGRR